MTYLCICITELNSDITFEFISESDREDSGNGLYYSRFAVGYMSDCADIDCGLSKNKLVKAYSECRLIDREQLGFLMFKEQLRMPKVV